MRYQTIKTQAGLALEAAAETGGPAIKLVSMSLGDGGGSAAEPTGTQTELVHEVARVTLNSLSQNPSDATQWTAEAVFPADSGGYTVREVGLWTDSDVLFAVANFPDTYKPSPSEGTAGQLLVSLNFRAQNSQNITLVVDGSLQLATRDFVLEQISSETQRAEAAEAKLQPIGDYATNAALKQETQRAQAAEGNLQPAGDYATNTALQQEAQRAQAAEDELLPLAGGNVTGTITRSGGGVLPEVLGMTGRVVIQAFTAQGNGPGGNGDVYVQFPVAFAANSTPIVSITINREPNGGRSRFVAVGNNGSGNLPNVNNAGFWMQPTWASSEGTGTTGQPWMIHAIAIGTL